MRWKTLPPCIAPQTRLLWSTDTSPSSSRVWFDGGQAVLLGRAGPRRFLPCRGVLTEPQAQFKLQATLLSLRFSCLVIVNARASCGGQGKCQNRPFPFGRRGNLTSRSPGVRGCGGGLRT